MNDIEAVARQAIDNAIKKMAEAIIKNQTAWVRTELQKVVIAKATALLKDDPEINKLLRDTLIQHIKNPPKSDRPF